MLIRNVNIIRDINISNIRILKNFNMFIQVPLIYIKPDINERNIDMYTLDHLI